jgi:uncharacterized protein YecT (DUF1311 family)
MRLAGGLSAVVLIVAVSGSAIAASRHNAKSALHAEASAPAKLCASPMTADVIGCAVEEQRDAERRMNQYYEGMRSRLGPTSRALLDDSQRKWAAYRDAYCQLEGRGVEGGNIQPMVIANCMAGMAKARAREIKPYVVCQDGDLSCPD